MAENTGSAPASTDEFKGKGKAATEDVSMDMDDDDSSSDEEIGAEEETHGGPLEEEDEDNMEEISTENIINDGRRTRGKTIDFAKAAETAGDDLDEDEDDDDDFEEKDEDDVMHD